MPLEISTQNPKLNIVRHTAYRHTAYRHIAYRHTAYRHTAHRHTAHRHTAHRHTACRHTTDRHTAYCHTAHRHTTYRHTAYRYTKYRYTTHRLHRITTALHPPTKKRTPFPNREACNATLPDIPPTRAKIRRKSPTASAICLNLRYSFIRHPNPPPQQRYQRPMTTAANLLSL